MYHYNYGGLVNERQKEIERKSYEAWKFADLKQESLLHKLFLKFFFTKKADQQNNGACICES